MIRVFTSQNTGAGIYVFSDDHCPPQVHARHRGEGWIARVRFSFVTSEVALLSIAPLRNSPLQRMVNHLLGDIEAELPACRRTWWAGQRTTCLENQLVVTSSGTIEVPLSAPAHAKKIETATYDSDHDRVRITFHDGTTLDTSAPP
jgi:hypothetical protein